MPALGGVLSTTSIATSAELAAAAGQAGATDVAVADGGTGASTAAGARTNLGISAANTPFTPAGTIAATDVQAAIEEVAAEAGGTGIAQGGPFTEDFDGGAFNLKNLADPVDPQDAATAASTFAAVQPIASAIAELAPADATYLVTAAHADLDAEIVVGASPGGELGGTWASPTVDATHSGSTHAAAQAAAEATAASALSSHEADSTSVHGITNTASLYVAGGTDVAVADGGTGASTAAAARTNLDLALVVPVKPPFRTGGPFYYPSWDGAFSTLVLVQDTQYATPFYIPETITAIRIGVLATGVASSSVNLAIYNDNAGVPDSLLLDAGSAATTATAVAEKTINQSLVRGWYWLACAVQGANGSIFSNAVSGVSSSRLPVTSPATAFCNAGYTRTGVNGAAPSPWGATKTITSRVPVMLLGF